MTEPPDYRNKWLCDGPTHRDGELKTAYYGITIIWYQYKNMMDMDMKLTEYLHTKIVWKIFRLKCIPTVGSSRSS